MISFCDPRITGTGGQVCPGPLLNQPEHLCPNRAGIKTLQTIVVWAPAEVLFPCPFHAWGEVGSPNSSWSLVWWLNKSLHSVYIPGKIKLFDPVPAPSSLKSQVGVYFLAQINSSISSFCWILPLESLTRASYVCKSDNASVIVKFNLDCARLGDKQPRLGYTRQPVLYAQLKSLTMEFTYSFPAAPYLHWGLNVEFNPVSHSACWRTCTWLNATGTALMVSTQSTNQS